MVLKDVLSSKQGDTGKFAGKSDQAVASAANAVRKLNDVNSDIASDLEEINSYIKQLESVAYVLTKQKEKNDLIIAALSPVVCKE